MKAKIISALGLLGLALAWAQAGAHHSFAAEFDMEAPIELTGTVTKVEWANPHTFIHIDVSDPSGRIENWALELGSPNGLMRRGWTRNSLKVGDTVSVTGWRARDGSLKGNAKTVVLSTGRQLFAGTSNEAAKEDQ